MKYVGQSEGTGADDESDKSKSEVNDDEDDDEDGSADVYISPLFLYNVSIRMYFS